MRRPAAPFLWNNRSLARSATISNTGRSAPLGDRIAEESAMRSKFAALILAALGLGQIA